MSCQQTHYQIHAHVRLLRQRSVRIFIHISSSPYVNIRPPLKYLHHSLLSIVTQAESLGVILSRQQWLDAC